jgi:hypothetical protein
MINAELVFAAFLTIWGFIGILRGWTRELFTTISLVLALFIYSIPNCSPNQCVDQLLRPLVGNDTPVWRFIRQSLPFLVIAFFGYLGPIITRVQIQGLSGRRLKIWLFAFAFGIANGYFLFSTLTYWAFQAGVLAEYTNLFTPPPGGWQEFLFVKSAAPVILSGSLLTAALIGLVLFLIVVVV